MSSKWWVFVLAGVSVVAVAAVIVAAGASRSTDISGDEPLPERTTTTRVAPPEASDPIEPDQTGNAVAFSTCKGIPQTFPLPPRSCRFVTPSNVRSGERLPLVILLHGFNTTPEAEFAQGHWAETLEQKRFVVALPEGQYGSWNAGGCCAISQRAAVDDVGYLRAVLDQAVARPDVDPARVVVVGESNGGMMAYAFGCATAGRLAGIASVAGTAMVTCAPERPIPVLHVHGTADLTVPYQGGQSLISWVLGVTFPSVPQAMNAVAGAMGCTGEPKTSVDGPVSTQTWSCPAPERVQLDTIDGQQHAWPRGPAYDATDRIVEFFGLS